jgi:hypothetical protein
MNTETQTLFETLPCPRYLGCVDIFFIKVVVIEISKVVYFVEEAGRRNQIQQCSLLQQQWDTNWTGKERTGRHKV